MFNSIKSILISFLVVFLTLNSANAIFWDLREHVTIDVNSQETIQLTAGKKYTLGIRNLPKDSFQAYIKPASGDLKQELIVENLVKQVKSTTVDFNLKTSEYLATNHVEGSLVLVVYMNYHGGNLSKASYSIPISITV